MHNTDRCLLQRRRLAHCGVELLVFLSSFCLLPSIFSLVHGVIETIPNHNNYQSLDYSRICLHCSFLHDVTVTVFADVAARRTTRHR